MCAHAASLIARPAQAGRGGPGRGGPGLAVVVGGGGCPHLLWQCCAAGLS